MLVYFYKTPIGFLKLVISSKGVAKVEFAGERVEVGEKSPHSEPRSKKVSTTEDETLEKCVQWLDDYFSGTLNDHVNSLPPLDIQHKSSFYREIWTTLMNTFPGETLSYSELAKRSGHPGTARATGQAVKSHHLPILIPCHRVVKSGGRDIGNYSGGEGPVTKKWLLDHEKAMINKKD